MTRPPRIQPDSLRDHAEPARVNRVWRRLERRLALSTAATGGVAAERRRSRVTVLGVAAAALIATFGAGVVLGRKIESRPALSAGAVAAPDEASAQSPTLFAAGTMRQAYDLPGGGRMVVSPGGIVERVSQAPGEVSVRLVRGEAELSTEGASERTRLSVLVGGASVATDAGVVRVRTDGETADFEVLSGSADISSPDPEVGLRLTTVRERERLTVPIRVTVTHVPPAELTAPLVPPRPVPIPKIAREPVPGEPPPPVVPAPLANWQQLCQVQDYEGVRKELQANAVDVGKVTNPRDLLCIADATHRGNSTLWRQVLERVLKDNDPQLASVAAYQIALQLERSGSHDEAAKYYQKYRDLSPGGALAEDALCKLIEAEDVAGHRDEALRLGQKYLADTATGHATGSCRAHVEQMLQRLTTGTAGQQPKTEGDKGDDQKGGPTPDGSGKQGTGSDSGKKGDERRGPKPNGAAAPKAGEAPSGSAAPKDEQKPPGGPAAPHGDAAPPSSSSGSAAPDAPKPPAN